MSDIKYASGTLIVAKSTQRFFLARRAAYISDPLMWSCPGGGVDPGEDYFDAAIRELEEEVGYSGKIDMRDLYTIEGPEVTYKSWLGIVDSEFEPTLNWESDKADWFTLEEVLDLCESGILHPGLITVLDERGDFILKCLDEACNRSLYASIFENKKYILSEGLSSTVYHYTKDPIGIYESDKMMASPALSSDTIGKSAMWFISTSRSLTASYMPHPSQAGATILELDGDKLSNNYSAMPIEYWYTGGESQKSIAGYRSTEMEDRIMLSKPEIKNISKYIRRIIVISGIQKNPDGSLSLLEKSNPHLRYMFNLLTKTKEYCNKNNIELGLSLSSPEGKLHKHYSTIDTEEVLNLYRQRLAEVADESYKDLDLHFEIRKLNLYANWISDYSIGKIAKMIHLMVVGWVPPRWARYDGEFSSKFLPEYGKFILYIPSDSFHNERRGLEREFLNAMLKTMKRMGLKSLNDKDYIGFFVENYSWSGNIDNSGLTKNEKPQWDKVEQSLPIDLQEKILSSREELLKLKMSGKLPDYINTDF